MFCEQKIPEGKSVLDEWFLCFKFKDGLSNREVVMRSFMNYFHNPGREMWIPPGSCMLGGKVYGSELFSDGAPIMTSSVKSITKIGETKKHFGEICAILKAITGSGTEYYFQSDEKSREMFLLMGDLTYLNLISNQVDRYVPPEYRAKGLL